MLILLKLWHRLRAHAGSALCVVLLLLAMGGTWTVASPRAVASPGPVTTPNAANAASAREASSASKTRDASPTSSDSSGSPAIPSTSPSATPSSSTPSVATSSSASSPTTASSPTSATSTAAGPSTPTGSAGSSPTTAPSTGRRGHKELAGKLNLNDATEQQLQLLPTVGPAKAERIVTWRKKNGGFHRIADLRRVKGFGYRTFKKLEPFLDIAGDTTLAVVK